MKEEDALSPHARLVPGAILFRQYLFIAHALTVSYIYIYCSKFALILLRNCPAYVYELSLAFVVDIFKAQSDVKFPTIVHPLNINKI